MPSLLFFPHLKFLDRPVLRLIIKMFDFFVHVVHNFDSKIELFLAVEFVSKILEP